ncbi:A24 family peptidase [Vibrio owensii]|uniref:A24 family peptidase n=1 Tax=Vibrio owensii TaxID=696485 RepID=UPI003CE4E1F3
MSVSGLALIALFGSSVVVSISDIRKRIIRNWHVLIIAFLSAIIGWEYLTQANFLYLIALWVILFLVYFSRAIGGGDVKLIAAFSLALPPSDYLFAVVLTVAFGGLLSIFYLVKDRLILRIDKEKERGVPYGLAICVGFCFTAFSNIA